MSRWFRSIAICLSVIIFVATLLEPGKVSANDHDAISNRWPTTSGLPPLPSFKPQIGPSLLFGYHQTHNFPTKTEKWIDVDLSEQRVVAYAGKEPVRAFIVSTGLLATPTVQGTFRIRMKVRTQTMSGGSAAYGYYNLPNVEWVQYFYEGYAFHGTYWHNNFGQPMSHGCVNMTNEDAKWLFDWAGPVYDRAGAVWQTPTPDNRGTLVVVHE